MKVYIVAYGSDQWQNGQLIYREAVRQKKDVSLGFIEWPFTHLLRDIQRTKPDWIFLTGSRALPPEKLRELTKIAPLALWDADALDAQRCKIWQSICGIPSIVFGTVSDLSERFPTLSPKTLWTPQYFDPHTYAPTVPRPTTEAEFNSDVCFIGDFTGRNLTTFITKAGTQEGYKVNRVCGVWGRDAGDVYSTAKIALGLWRPAYFSTGDITTSDRMYKAMGAGCFYLLHPVNGLEQMFVPGQHLDVHDGTPDGMSEKISYYLAHPKEREEIARNGQAEVLEKHTITHRVSMYWEEMKKGI